MNTVVQTSVYDVVGNLEVSAIGRNMKNVLATQREIRNPKLLSRHSHQVPSSSFHIFCIESVLISPKNLF
jgi:hypothetical protein